MHSSSVLIVHPTPDRFRLPDMANGKLMCSAGAGNVRHYSVDSSLTSPPGYGPGDVPGLPQSLIDQKPPIAMTPMSMPSSSGMSMSIGCSAGPQFPSFNPHLVMAPSAAGSPGLLHLGKCRAYKITIEHA